MTSPRNGRDTAWPPQAIDGPKVMVANESSGSGGDVFAWLFKHQKVGPLVGTRTYGALVGTGDDIPLLGGGHVTAPELGFWADDNVDRWIVENQGVEPDYFVEDRPDLVVLGHDPQLAKAIQLAMDALEKRSPPPHRPEYPQRN